MSEFNTLRLNTEIDPREGSALEDGAQVDLQPKYKSENLAPQGEAQRTGATGQTWERPPSPEMLKRNEVGQAAVNVTVMRADALHRQKKFYQEPLTQKDMIQDNFGLAG